MFKNNSKILTGIKKHKLIVILGLLVFIFPATYGYNKYLDWDNAQMINGLAKDFPALVAEIESATGLDLEIKTDCSITQEKFSTGVKTCEMSIVSQASQQEIDKSVDIIVSTKNFEQYEHNDVSKASRIKYTNKKSCTLSESGTMYLSCITAVREANIDLAKQVLLNQQ